MDFDSVINLDVCGRFCVPEALLLEKVDFVVKISQLFKKRPVVLLQTGGLGDGQDHLFWHCHLVDKLSQFTPDGLPVLQLDVHVHRLLLKAEDFRRDRTQVRLKVEEHAFHAAKQRVALNYLKTSSI